MFKNWYFLCIIAPYVKMRTHLFLCNFRKLWKATVIFIMSIHPSVCMEKFGFHQIITKFCIWIFLKNLLRKFKFHWNLRSIMGTLHEDMCTFMMLISSLNEACLRQNYRENQNPHFLFSNFIFFENCAIYEIMWKYMVEPSSPRMTL